MTNGDPRSSMYASVGVRAVLAGTLGAALLTGRSLNLAVVALVVIAVLAFDRRHLVTLRNFVLGYTVVVFGLGTAVLHYAPTSVVADIVAYVLVFLAGYAVASARRTSSEPAALATAGSRQGRSGDLNLRAVEGAIVALVAVNVAFLAFQFEKYGIGAYYRGQALLDQFLTYGEASPTGGAEQIVRFLLKFGAIGLTIVYAQACFQSSTRIRYRYPVTLLVALPILSLRRYDAVVGALTVLAVYACERRIVRPGGATARTGGGRRPARTLVLGAAMASAVLAAVAIGVLRQGFLADSGAGIPDPGALPVLTSELSPVRAYDDITANIDALGHPGGRTILAPLLLKVVPRAWYPDKPMNSAAYYLSIVRPGELAAGFAVPPTFYGDVYLSFGFGGALAACLLLGAVAACLDRASKLLPTGRARLALFLIVWANAFSLMRDPLSESLAGVLLTLGVWFVARHLLVRREPAAVPPDHSPVPATAAVG